MCDLSPHHLRIKGQDETLTEAPDAAEHADQIRAWLTALVSAEHLSVLVGSGLGVGIAYTAGTSGLAMDPVTFGAPHGDEVGEHARRSAAARGRGDPNIEDQLRSALALLAGLEVLGADEAKEWREEIDGVLRDFATRGLQAEKGIREAIESDSDPAVQRAAQPSDRRPKASSGPRLRT